MSFSTNQSTDTITSSTGNGSLSGFNVNFATNRLVNPFMSIDQANEGASITMTGSNGPYVADQWAANFVQTGLAGTTTVQTVADAPTGLPGGKSIKFTMGTGHAISATDFACFSQHIEAYNATDLAFGTASASPISISFWVKTSLAAGTFSIALINAAGNRTYLANYTVASANTWTKITLPNIPGDITGTWVTETNGIGLQVLFVFGAGSTYQGAAGWQAGSFFGTSSNTNLLATTGATFQITGVQLEPGPVCSPLERRPFAIEFAICQRYFQKTFPRGTTIANGGSSYIGALMMTLATTATAVQTAVWRPAIELRATPTITTYNPRAGGTAGLFTNASTDDTGAPSPGNNGPSNVQLISNSATLAGGVWYIHATADARL